MRVLKIASPCQYSGPHPLSATQSRQEAARLSRESRTGNRSVRKCAESRAHQSHWLALQQGMVDLRRRNVVKGGGPAQLKFERDLLQEGRTHLAKRTGRGPKRLVGQGAKEAERTRSERRGRNGAREQQERAEGEEERRAKEK